MPLFRALGFGVLLVIIRFMLPTVFHAGEATAVTFLEGAQASALTATDLIHSAPQLSSSRPQFALPQAPQVTPF